MKLEVLTERSVIDWVLCLVVLLLASCAAIAQAQDQSAPTGGIEPYPEGSKGDLWVMAGQSNMDGHCAIRTESAGPDPRILMLCVDGKWRPLEEPTIRMSFPHADMENPTAYNHTNTPTDQARGVSSQFFFAEKLLEETGRPIGIISACTGKPMPQVWNPDKAGENPDFIYRQLVDRVNACGGRGNLKGIVYYQGESDAVEDPAASEVYEESMLKFIDRLRADTANPELPFVVVQLARLATGAVPGRPGQSGGGAEMADLFGGYTEAWERVREVQRRLPELRDNVFTVSTVDLYPLADPIHLDEAAMKRLGRRTTEVALSQVYGMSGYATPIRLEEIEIVESHFPPMKEPMPGVTTIRVKYGGVNGRLTSPGAPAGFELVFPDLPAEAGSRPMIYRIDFDPTEPAVVLLRVSGSRGGEGTGPAGLYYGRGLNPYCNIVDEMDMGLPAFGPLRVPPGGAKVEGD